MLEKPSIRPKIRISKTPNIKMLWPSENTRILEWNFIAIWFDASSKFQTNVQMNFVRKYVFVSKFFFHGNYVDCLYFTIVLFISLNQVNVLRVLFGNIGLSQVDRNPLGVLWNMHKICRCFMGWTSDQLQFLFCTNPWKDFVFWRIFSLKTWFLTSGSCL